MDYIVDKQGKKRKAVKVICDYCGKEFLKPERFVKNSNQNFCSKKCAHDASKKQIELICDYCGKIFISKPSRLKLSKSGLHFCCRKCKDEAQKIISGIKELQLPHYGTTKYVDYTPQNIYQRICFTYHPHKCCICGEEKIVAVHHYDGNHFNNEPSNLVPLCPTHHCYIHSRFKNLIIDKVMEYIENFKRK